ncbi:hypothetical protein Tco_1040847 [Tanacetum coccineum]|uniref:Uncharacterized protein n=1 Tax=Tanacetum coccineum TaxID=301880 RepID=A0ABQ5GGW5_9ASTR
MGEEVQVAVQRQSIKFQEEAQAEKKEYIDLVDTSVRDIIKEEVKKRLPKIFSKAVSDLANPVIQQTVIESLENIVSAKSSSAPKSIYAAAASLAEFELKNIRLDKMQLSKSYKSGGHEDKDKDEDPTVGSNQRKKRRRTSNNAESLKDPKIRDTKSQSSSKGITRSQPKSSGKSAPVEEPVFEVDNSKVPQDQGADMGRPPTPDPNWNKGKSIDFRHPQTWISKMAPAGKPPLTFNELMDTPIDFSAFILNPLNITNLTQQHLVRLAFELLERTCKSRVELEYHFEEVYKATTDRLDWHNPKGKEYLFDLSKPLLLITNSQAIHRDYFINNDLKYLKGGRLSRKYTTLVTKTKAAKYDIKWIEDMVSPLWSPTKVSKHDVYTKRRIIAMTRLSVMKWYDYGYLEEIEVRRDDQQLYKFKQGDFPRLHLHDIEDMLLLLVNDAVIVKLSQRVLQLPR